MNDQLTMDFSTLQHFENSFDNQLHFEENKEHFSNQCRKVYEALLRGERLTTLTAIVNYGIGDLRRRIKDLKDNWQVPIISEYIINKDGSKSRYKEHYLTLNKS